VDDAWQDGFHLDGSWTGHRQNQTDVLFERCTATRCGRRTSPASVEKFRSGFYVQTGRLVDCRSEFCANAGFGIINERANSLVVEDCEDIGSAYGMILNYGAPGARIKFTSKAAKVRAFVGQAGSGGGTLDLTVIAPPSPAITFGRALRIDYLGCDNHAAQQRDKYDRLGYSINRSAITINAVEKPTVEEWKTSSFNGVYQFLPLVVDEPEVEPPPIVLPPAPEPYILSEDGALKNVMTDGRVLMQVGGFMDPAAREEFPHGTIWRRVVE